MKFNVRSDLLEISQYIITLYLMFTQKANIYLFTTSCLIICLINILKIYKYNSNNVYKQVYTLKHTGNYIYIIALIWCFFHTIVLEHETYNKKLLNNSFTYVNKFLFYDKALNPEMILLYILGIISIVLHIYMSINNKPLICENGFFTTFGLFIDFKDIINITQKRDITKILLSVKCNSDNYLFVFEGIHYKEISNFLSLKKVTITNEYV